jgi:hypothetical protein
MEACRTRGLQQACPREQTPTGQAETARVLRPRQEACLGLREWTRPFARSRALAHWLTSDTDHDLHSSLGERTPRPFELEDPRRHSSPFVAA